MTEQGVVTKLNGEFALVRIERNSACGSCGKCGMTENQKHVDFYVENVCSAAVGDSVELDIPDANTAGMAFIGYILPLIPALALLFVGIVCKWGELWSVVLFFVGLAVGYVVVAIIDKAKKRKWAQSPQMVRIVSSTAANT